MTSYCTGGDWLRRSGKLRSRAGYTLVEMLVATAILSLVMGTAYVSLISQIRRHADQMMAAEMLHAGRVAFDEMTEEIGNAGFGVPHSTTPSQAPTIVVAQADKLQFWAVASTVHTFLTANAATGASTVTLLSTAGLKAGASAYVSDQSRWYLGTIKSISGSTVQFTTTLPFAFAAGSLLTPASLVTYELVKGSLTRNGHAFIPNVTNLRFTYDSATAGSVHLIDVSMTVQARGNELGSVRRTVTLGARIAPPNLVL